MRSVVPLHAARRGDVAPRQDGAVARRGEVVERRQTRLWLPLPLSILWVLLAPFAIFLSLFAVFAPPRYRINGPEAAVVFGLILFSLSGTRIEVKSAHADLFILII